MSPKALSDLDCVRLAEDLAGPTVSARMQAGWWSPASRSWTASSAPWPARCSSGSRVIRQRRPALCLVELKGFEPLTLACHLGPSGQARLVTQFALVMGQVAIDRCGPPVSVVDPFAYGLRR